MKKVDLHIHTVATVSDHYFEFSMDTLQSYVECKELDAIAVTNHNLFSINMELKRQVANDQNIICFNE